MAGRTLIILAHPRPDSLSAALAGHVEGQLQVRGLPVRTIDLCASKFEPVMGAGEHADYGNPDNLADDLTGLAAALKEAENLVFVFPTWWSGPPAILKGFFDRLFVPGLAFDVDSTTSRMAGRLSALRRVMVVTTTGAPAWTIRLWLGNPVEKLFRRGIFAACAPKARIEVLMLHAVDQSTASRRKRFFDRIAGRLARW